MARVATFVKRAVGIKKRPASLAPVGSWTGGSAVSSLSSPQLVSPVLPEPAPQAGASLRTPIAHGRRNDRRSAVSAQHSDSDGSHHHSGASDSEDEELLGVWSAYNEELRGLDAIEEGGEDMDSTMSTGNTPQARGRRSRHATDTHSAVQDDADALESSEDDGGSQRKGHRRRRRRRRRREQEGDGDGGGDGEDAPSVHEQDDTVGASPGDSKQHDNGVVVGRRRGLQRHASSGGATVEDVDAYIASLAPVDLAVPTLEADTDTKHDDGSRATVDVDGVEVVQSHAAHVDGEQQSGGGGLDGATAVVMEDEVADQAVPVPRRSGNERDADDSDGGAPDTRGSGNSAGSSSRVIPRRMVRPRQPRSRGSDNTLVSDVATGEQPSVASHVEGSTTPMHDSDGTQLHSGLVSSDVVPQFNDIDDEDGTGGDVHESRRERHRRRRRSSKRRHRRRSRHSRSSHRSVVEEGAEYNKDEALLQQDRDGGDGDEGRRHHSSRARRRLVPQRSSAVVVEHEPQRSRRRHRRPRRRHDGQPQEP